MEKSMDKVASYILMGINMKDSSKMIIYKVKEFIVKNMVINGMAYFKMVLIIL
jgi:hypothetical protein